MVIFGVTGDLTSRKLMPALYDLAVGNPSPRASRSSASRTAIGPTRVPRKDARGGHRNARTPVTEEMLAGIRQGSLLRAGRFPIRRRMSGLGDRLETIDAERRTEGNRLFYLATPPSYFLPIIESLDAAAVSERQANIYEPSAGWHRIVVEKPFGHDVPIARELNQEIADVFSERQIYRIDHYLGKETVQNMLAFRFANILFEPVWNRHYVDHVQITVAESLGVEGRAGYYEGAGALRDMVQSHMLQLLTVVRDGAARALQRQRASAMKRSRCCARSCPRRARKRSQRWTVRGQYAGLRRRQGGPRIPRGEGRYS